MDGPIYCICEPVRVRLPELSASKLLVIWQKHEVRKDSCGLESQKHFQCFVQPCHFPRARPIFRMTLLRSPPVIAWSVSCHKQGPWCNAGPSWFETKPNNSRWPICFHLILRRFKLWSPFQLRVLEDGTPVQDVRFAKGMNVHDILTIFRCLNLGGCLNFCARLKPFKCKRRIRDAVGPTPFLAGDIKVEYCYINVYLGILIHRLAWDPEKSHVSYEPIDALTLRVKLFEKRQLKSLIEYNWLPSEQEQILPHFSHTYSKHAFHSQTYEPIKHRDNVLQGTLIATQPSHAPVINLIRISACSAWTDKLRETLPRTNDTPMDECDY